MAGLITSADERLRAAKAAVAERAHLLRVRAQLVADVASEQRRVEQLRVELRREQADVARLSTGVMGFLNEILGGEQALAREQREAHEADVRLREASASLDTLRAQAAAVESRLAQLAPDALERELRAARAAKQAAVLASGGRSAAELQDLAIRIESIDIELVPLDDAVAAGDAALAVLAEIIAALDAARAGGPATVLSNQRAVRGMAGEAQARVQLFRRTLEELATSSLDAPPAQPPLDDAFADPWIRALFAKRPAAERLAAARTQMVERLERLHARLAPLRARQAELASRRAVLVQQRDLSLER